MSLYMFTRPIATTNWRLLTNPVASVAAPEAVGDEYTASLTLRHGGDYLTYARTYSLLPLVDGQLLHPDDYLTRYAGETQLRDRIVAADTSGDYRTAQQLVDQWSALPPIVYQIIYTELCARHDAPEPPSLTFDLLAWHQDGGAVLDDEQFTSRDAAEERARELAERHALSCNQIL